MKALIFIFSDPSGVPATLGDSIILSVYLRLWLEYVARRMVYSKSTIFQPPAFRNTRIEQHREAACIQSRKQIHIILRKWSGDLKCFWVSIWIFMNTARMSDRKWKWIHVFIFISIFWMRDSPSTLLLLHCNKNYFELESSLQYDERPIGFLIQTWNTLCSFIVWCAWWVIKWHQSQFNIQDIFHYWTTVEDWLS